MVHPELEAHNNQFQKTIEQLAPGFYTAVGYAASNVHMVEGAFTITIIDTTESTKAAENILTEFRKITSKPIARIIFTHSHRDHISGASVFSDGTQPIVASHLFDSDLIDVNPDVIAANKALGRRTQAQFGIGLDSQARVNLGCGPGDRPVEGLGQGFLPPTEFITEDRVVDLDGVSAKLILAPGETADHMIVWFPEQQLLVGGDNWYHAFPNLYAIRGTAYRDFAAWAGTLDRMAALGAAILAPGHTRPVTGVDAVKEVLISTRDAITHVMQHTADGMDKGLSLDDIATSVVLPAHLAEKPWLKEFYGKLGWSARAFAVGTLGWYDGNPTNLGSLSSRQRAQHMAELAGGVEELASEAKTTDDLQWRLELCDHLLALEYSAEIMKAETLETLAETEINATARNSYLWEAKRLRG